MYWNSVFEIGEFIQFLEQQITEPKSAEEAAAAIYHEGFRYLDNFKTMSGERERAIDFLFENINTILFAEYVATSVNRSELQ